MGNGCSADPTDPSHVKIEYFSGGHGRAEPLRVLLHHAGVPFTDDTVSLTGWMWRKTINNTGEMGGLPIVHYQGRQMQQTGAVLRAFGTEKGYYNPADWKQAAKIDWIIDTWGDLLTQAAGIIFQFDSEAVRQSKWQDAAQTKWRPFLVKLEAQLQKGGHKFIAGETVTIGDCVMFSVCHNIFQNETFHGQPFFRAEFNNYPLLVAYASNIEREFASFANSREQQQF